MLQDNGVNNLTVNSNGSFAFSAAIASGGAYSVTVLQQPSNPVQTCTVANGGGAASANVTNIQVTCATSIYPVGGTVGGLVGTGLVLEDNGGDNLSIVAGATVFTFTNFITAGKPYNVTVFAQPANPAQTCTVTNGAGIVNGDVTSVLVTCTSVAGNTFTIGGTVTNLADSGGGLQLQNGGEDTLVVNANGSFTFPSPVVGGTTYKVTVSIQPSFPMETCAVTNGAGIATENVTSVVVNCGRGDWKWVNGSNAIQTETNGTQTIAAASNGPGARESAVTWTDASKCLAVWRRGLDSTGQEGLGTICGYTALVNGRGWADRIW